MDPRFYIAFLQVHDQDEALKFYRDVLGFKVTADVVFDGQNRWLTVCPPNQPEVNIMLEKVGMGRPEADQRMLAELLAKGSLPGAVFRITNADETFEAIRQSGAEVLQEPIDQPYGVRDFAFRDPSGNELRFSQLLA